MGFRLFISLVQNIFHAALRDRKNGTIARRAAQIRIRSVPLEPTNDKSFAISRVRLLN